MVTVRTLRPHAKQDGLGTWNRGEVYQDGEVSAAAKFGNGLIEYTTAPVQAVRTKESPELYQRISVAASSKPAVVTLTEKRGNWFSLSNGEKVLGKTAAAEALGITVDELGALGADTHDD